MRQSSHQCCTIVPPVFNTVFSIWLKVVVIIIYNRYVYVYVYICICICAYVYVYVYILGSSSPPPNASVSVRSFSSVIVAAPWFLALADIANQSPYSLLLSVWGASKLLSRQCSKQPQLTNWTWPPKWNLAIAYGETILIYSLQSYSPSFLHLKSLGELKKILMFGVLFKRFWSTRPQSLAGQMVSILASSCLNFIFPCVAYLLLCVVWNNSIEENTELRALRIQKWWKDWSRFSVALSLM